jgi:hypothetical protein
MVTQAAGAELKIENGEWKKEAAAPSPISFNFQFFLPVS